MAPEKKRAIKPWTSLINQKKLTPNQVTPLAEIPTSELAESLQSGLRNIDNTNLKTLQKNIDIANEIINREPESYSAYKGKLMSMLIIEGKFNQAIDEAEVENLLETMARFDIKTEESARNEALLISNTNNEIRLATEKLNEIALQEDTVNTDFEQDEVFRREEAQIEEIERLQVKLNRATVSEDNYINEDIVQIPFFRMMAKNDFEQTITNAENFIEKFPDSPYGHFFLVNALNSLGQREEALNILKELPENLQNKIQIYDQSYFKDYWKKLFF